MRNLHVLAAAFLLMCFFQSFAAAEDNITAQRRATVMGLMNCFEKEVTHENLLELYTEDVRFIDPMTAALGLEISGIDDLAVYFGAMKKFLDSYSFTISTILTENNETDNSTFVVLYRHKNRFPLTKKIITDFVEYDCATAYKFQPGEYKAYYHQDYYDTTVVYRVIPGMKLLMKIIDRQTSKMFDF